METKHLMMSMALAAMALSSCNKDDNKVETIPNGEIRLTSGVAMQTRAFDIDQQINDGRTVAVYVDKTDGVQLYGNNVLTADGSGKFTGGTSMYFPADKAAINIYAMATNVTLAEAFPAAAITHTVSADQTTKADYSASDLLYSATTNVAFSKEAIPLTFYHMLSKVEVALVPGTGAPVLEGATVKILNTKLMADFTPSKTATMTNQSARAGMIVVNAGGTATPITIGNASSTGFNSPTYNEAVIVPQTLAIGAEFIEVTLVTGAILVYKLAAETTFESGKKYQYHITVNLTGLTVTSTIENWDPVNPVTGNAEME